ncbi:hypothetical protein llap_4607 [Limosa lapponica baueri]|uniref:Uncharacterized protein n=1 Tax=Limosa lapponica baueri TaxID=1758121 RepID=A0A2I0UGC2_LIMLA|nr:hypothetical protein llap_4607 [Limosa lapponica baueri]
MGAREGVEEAKAILPAGIGQCQGVGGPVAPKGDERRSVGGNRKELSFLQGSRSLQEGDGNTAPTLQQFANMLPQDSSGGDEQLVRGAPVLHPPQPLRCPYRHAATQMVTGGQQPAPSQQLAADSGDNAGAAPLIRGADEGTARGFVAMPLAAERGRSTPRMPLWPTSSSSRYDIIDN